MRILVVDDDPDVIEYLSSFLEDEGYQVESAGDETTALAAVERLRPDAILIDVLMPGRSGLDLLVRLRQDSRWSDIPLVVVTGSDRILQDDCQSYLGSHQDVRGPDGVQSYGEHAERYSTVNFFGVGKNGGLEEA